MSSYRWIPNDYVPNPQSDRDWACVQNRMAKNYCSTQGSKAAFIPGITKTEETFCNSIAQPYKFTVGCRFGMPTRQNVCNSNKTKFEGFQA